MSFIDEIKRLEDLYDPKIKGLENAYENLVEDKRKALADAVNEDLKKLRNGNSTGDEFQDFLLVNASRFAPIDFFQKYDDGILKGMVMSALKDSDFFNEIPDISPDNVEKVLKAVSYTLDLKDTLEKNRGKHLRSSLMFKVPKDKIEYIFMPGNYARDAEEGPCFTNVRMLGVISEEGDVMYVDENDDILINTKQYAIASFVARGRHEPEFRRKPKIVKSNMPYTMGARYRILEDKPDKSEYEKSMVESLTA